MTTAAQHCLDAPRTAAADREEELKAEGVVHDAADEVLAAQRAALIIERDEGRIEDEAVRAMLERLDLQEAGVSARLESRF